MNGLEEIVVCIDTSDARYCESMTVSVSVRE